MSCARRRAALPFLAGSFGGMWFYQQCHLAALTSATRNLSAWLGAGLVALAYSNSPNWPTYPNGISEDDVNNCEVTPSRISRAS